MNNKKLFSIICEVFSITSPQAVEKKIQELSSEELEEIVAAFQKKHTPVRFRTAA